MKGSPMEQTSERITFERSIWINAPRERVWQAVTEPEQIQQWFLPAVLGATMTRDDQNRLSVSFGPMTAKFAVLENIDPPHKVTTRALPDRLLATTYALEDDNGGTRLTVKMSGFEALPEDMQRDRLNLTGTGWEQALANLKAFVAGEEKPYPFTGVAALFGFFREPKEKLAVERSIWIKASRERVWQAITDPDQIEQWFSPGTKWRGTGLKVGGQISVYNAELDKDMYIQVIEHLDPPHQLITRSVPEEEGEVPHVSIWTLVEENGGTRLLITNTGYELETPGTREQGMEQNAFGFGMMLENLKAVIEGTELPVPGGF
jgi:uncharacterized protein YndB with AHSA1/START domain